MLIAATLTILLSLAVTGVAGTDRLYSLIKEGRLAEAASSLSLVSTATLRDGNSLFFLSLLEPDAGKAADLMRAALNASVSPVYHEEIHYRLAQYYFLKGEYRKLSQQVTTYRARWEAGAYRCQMMRYSILIDEIDGRHESAIRLIDRYLLEYAGGDRQQLGTIDKARVMKGFGKRIAATKLLRGLSRERSGVGVPQAFYQLTRDAIAAGRTDDAVFYYNLLREAYPAAVGLGALVDRMAGMSTSDAGDNAAEKLTGTFYSVQVGVFAESGNAKRQAKLFKQYDRKVETKSRKISGRTYKVVYVGRFQSYDEAERFKQMLERNHNEHFQVVAR